MEPPFIDRLMVAWPTSVPKLTPKRRSASTFKNSSTVCQFTFIWLTSVHFLIDSSVPYRSGAKDEPQCPPIMVVTPCFMKSDCPGFVMIDRYWSDEVSTSMKPGVK